MADIRDPHIPTSSVEEHHGGPNLKVYLMVFYSLAFLTAVSFIVNFFLGPTATSAGIILLVAVVKAFLVGSIFMHLKFDWSKLYGIVIPVVVMAIMMMVVLMDDIVLYWHHH